MDAQVMELIGYDKEFNKVAYIPFLNLQWKRKYYTYGSFSFQILAEDYDPNIKYVHSAQRPEIGIIERMETTQNIKGYFVQLSGRFMESIFDRQLAFPKLEGEYTVNDILDILIYPDYVPDLYVIFHGDVVRPTEIVDLKWDKDELATAAYETLKTLELSMRMTFDPDTKRLTMIIWEGLDRTQTQNTNGYAVFSDDNSAMVASFSYIEDESDYKSAAMMLYEEPQENADEDADPVILREDVEVGDIAKYGRRWIAVDTDYEDTTENRRQQGIEELQKSPLVQEAKIEVNQVGLMYLTDYDLGDKCQLVSKRYHKDFTARITSVDEVWKQGKYEVKLGFGEQTQTKYRKMRNFINRHQKMHRFYWW